MLLVGSNRIYIRKNHNSDFQQKFSYFCSAKLVWKIPTLPAQYLRYVSRHEHQMKAALMQLNGTACFNKANNNKMT